MNSGRLGGTGRRQESDTGSSLRGACWLARHLSPPPTETTTLTAVTAFDPGHFSFFFFLLSLFVLRSHETAAASHVFSRPGQRLGGDEKR